MLNLAFLKVTAVRTRPVVQMPFVQCPAAARTISNVVLEKNAVVTANVLRTVRTIGLVVRSRVL